MIAKAAISLPDARSRRARLDASLDRLSHCNAILVSAPPGYGKSVLMARWRRLLIGMGRTVIWLPGKPDLTLADIVSQVCGSPAKGTLERLSTHLYEFLAIQDRGVSILTDRLDFIGDPAILPDLAGLLAGLPRDVQWIFTSRRPLPEAWLGLLAYSLLGMIREDQLRFTSDEVAELSLDLRDPRLIEQARGVPLFLEALRSGELEANGIGCWLDEHVWPFLPPEVRLYADTLALLRDVPLEEGLVKTVCDCADGALVIEMLRHETPLVEVREGEPRLHCPAGTLAPDASFDIEAIGGIHRRAAHWLAKRDPQAAIVHALAGGETDLAYRLIEQELRNAVSRGRVAQALEWLRTLPVNAFADHGGMDATIAWALVIGGRLEEAEAWLADAIVRDPSFAASGFDALLRGLIACQRDDPDETKGEMSKLTAAQISDLPPQFEAVRLNTQRWIAQLSGDAWLPSITVRLHPLDPRSDPRHFYTLCFAAYRDIEVALDVGHAGEAIRHVAPLLERARWELGGNASAVAFLSAGLAAAYRQSGNVAMAAALLGDCQFERESWALPSSIWIATRTRAQNARDAGDLGTAIGLVEGFIEDAAQRQLFRLSALAEAELARLYTSAGSLAQLRACVDRITMLALRSSGPLLKRQIALPQALATAHAAIFELDWLTASEALRRGHLLACRMRRAVDGAEIEMLSAALPESAPSPRLTRRRMLPLLDAPDREALTRYLGTAPAAARSRARRSEECGPEITLKEREILELVAAGVSNKRIAQALMVSPETVKWHLKNIYNKLDVHDRHNVVIRARELEFID